MSYFIEVPGAVWEDFLDPDASGMELALGLRDRRATPFVRRYGRGCSYRYSDVPRDVVVELAEYLVDRGDTLLGQGVSDPYDRGEKASRDALRRAVALGQALRSPQFLGRAG